MYVVSVWRAVFGPSVVGAPPATGLGGTPAARAISLKFDGTVFAGSKSCRRARAALVRALMLMMDLLLKDDIWLRLLAPSELRPGARFIERVLTGGWVQRLVHHP